MPLLHSSEAALRRRLLCLGAAGALLWGVPVWAADSVPASAVPVAGRYRGVLDGAPIELTLTLDTDAEDSVHGWYVRLDAHGAGGAHVLLAGEFDGDQLSMEESENGIDVSGTWNGTLTAQGFQGSWSDPQGNIQKPVTLTRVPA